MRWLHLSDLHVGRPGPSAQTSAFANLVGAINVALGSQPVDAILLTGDLAHAGKLSQYEYFASTILGPLRALPTCTDARVFVAPGNHDVDCDAALPLSWEILGTQRQELFFQESTEACDLRNPRAKSFVSYSQCLQANSLIGVDPLSNVSKCFPITTSAGTIVLVTTNTAFFCDKERQDREGIPAPDGSLRSVLQSCGTPDRVIVLGHHPINWFLPQHRNPFRLLLLTHKAIYLHGHTHELEVQFGSEGVESLGFGAAYHAPQGAPPTPYYRNTFAVCQLDSKLHIAPYHWDSENGRWTPTTALPPGFNHRSPVLADGWQFKLAQEAASPVLGLPSVPTPPRSKVIRLIPIAKLNGDDWTQFISYSRLLPSDVTPDKLTPKAGPSGVFCFEYTLPAGIHYVHCISAPGSHLSQGQVEDFNTRLDTEGYSSYTVITLGTLSEEAQTTYSRLRTRKAITIVTAQDLAGRLSAIGSFATALSKLNTAIADSEFALGTGGHPLLLVQEKLRTSWFFVVASDGSILAETDSRVLGLRQTRPELQTAAYQLSSVEPVQSGQGTPFDRLKYVAACREEFSAVKYPPLATVGLRFPGVSLEDLYVETGANVGEDEGATHALVRAFEDQLQGAQVDGVLREELNTYLRKRLHLESTQEHSSARLLYQQFGSVAILGEPGSGKTCFVRREILAYCAEQPQSWYEYHTPIFVPLAELASHIDGDPINLLTIAAILAVRRGIPLEEQHLQTLFARGLLAIFFDGLDEIVSVELRSRVLSAVRATIDTGRPIGNRFVLTSRPAAIHRVELPRTLETLRMRGLSNTEMRSLAERILAARISETRGTLRLDVQQLTPVDHSTIDQLFIDCHSSPGIDRLARNPLFLTLLVMIYANSGSASARRHRVYQQAITTLVSIRARQAGQRGLSESDLRKRLGAVALAVFRDPKGALPSYDRVLEQIRNIVGSERGVEIDRSEIEKYLQDVAEATGLLVFHRDTASDANTAITFMHHSFLEYYAAIGLSSSDYLSELPNLARIPRWRDVLTLLAGIIGDSGDLAPLVDTLLGINDSVEAITFDCTLLALDCALEIDIPPERAIRALLGRAQSSLASGVLQFDSHLREQLGRRLGRLMSGSGSPLLEKFFIGGLRSEDDDLCANYIDCLSHAVSDGSPSKEVLEAYDATCERQTPKVRDAICGAAARATPLRSAGAVKIIGASLSASKELHSAALRAILSAPSLGSTVVDQLARGVEESSANLAEQSARALLKIGLPLDPTNPKRALLLASSLRRVAESAPLDAAGDLSLTYTRADVEPLLGSQDSSLRNLGIRLLAWVATDESFVHDRLMYFVSGGTREDCAAALGSLRISRSAQRILTIPDAYVIRGLLHPSKTKDIRLAAARVLGTILFQDAEILRELIEYCKTTRNTNQYPLAVQVVSWAADDQELAVAFLLEEAERLITHKGKLSNQCVRDTSAVLMALDEVDTDGSPRLVSTLQSVVGDYRINLALRRRALYAFVAIASIDDAVRYLRGLLRSAPSRLGSAAAVASAKLAARCRQRLEYIKTIYPELPEFQDALVSYYQRSIGAFGGEDREPVVSATRAALADLRHLFNSYREFSLRKDSPVQMTLPIGA